MTIQNKAFVKTAQTICIILMFLLSFYGCREKGQKSSRSKGDKKMTSTITVTSPAFEDGAMIPSLYTCRGQNLSPAINWQDIPQGTGSIALTADDPDASVGDWVHWVVWNIPAKLTGLPESLSTDAALPDGTRQGITDFGRSGYGGPCPPSGTHRYYFKVYALDTRLDLPDTTTKKDLLRAMEGHIIARGRLMGKYKRQ